MDRYFDPIYYSLAAAILVALGYATFTGLRAWRRARTPALGTALGAIGTAVALLGGLVADSALKGSPYFQQVRFGAYYLGFLLITFCLEAAVRGAQQTGALSGGLAARPILWVPFIFTLGVACFYLFSPNTFSFNASGSQVQLAVYWLPMLTITGIGAVLLFLAARGIKDGPRRAHLLWIAAYAGLVLIGLLRESLILPDFGDPLTNLLVAFVPFLLASLCLCFAARAILLK